MPRPNRYHPYSRGSTAPPAPNPSQHQANYSAYSSNPSPPPTTLRVTRPRPRPRPSTPIADHLYQSMYPGYIRGITSDGKNLVARSILMGPDGVFHVQMEFVRFPSENPMSRALSLSPNPLANVPEHGQGRGVELRPAPVPVDPRLEQIRAMLGITADNGLGLDMQMQAQMKLGRREGVGEVCGIEDLIAVRPKGRGARRDSHVESEGNDDCALLSSDGSEDGDVDADGAGSVDEEWGLLMDGAQ